MDLTTVQRYCAACDVAEYCDKKLCYLSQRDRATHYVSKFVLCFTRDLERF